MKMITHCEFQHEGNPKFRLLQGGGGDKSGCSPQQSTEDIAIAFHNGSTETHFDINMEYLHMVNLA